MGLTISQKILHSHLGEGSSVEPGEEIGLVVDQCLTQDSTGTMAWLEFESLGLDRVQPDLVVSYVDHTNACFKGESSEDHVFLQSAASRFGAIFSRPGNGVCHQLHYERFGRPGATLLGSDSHTPTAGGLGMMGIGVGGMDVAVAMGGGFFFLKVPPVIRVEITGSLEWGVDAKDVILALLRRISVQGGLGHIIEFDGEGIQGLSVPQRATITNMGAETGATTSLFPSDDVTRRFLQQQGREDAWEEIAPDADAHYAAVHRINLSGLEPLVAMPGSPDNVASVAEVAGTKIQQVHIGSCTNGGWRDIYMASRMLEGKHVAGDCEVMVVPGSRQVFQMLLRDGSLRRLTDAGCRIMEPGCGPCIGMGFVPGDGHLSLRSVNRNWFGRGGNKNARLALSSVQVCAASALTGTIADPRTLEPVIIPEPEYYIDDTMFVHPAGKETPIVRGDNIVPLKEQKPLPKKIEQRVLIKVGDGVSTDDILPAGPLTQHLRSNLPKISEFVFHYVDPSFPGSARDNGGGFIAAGDNYGQGSSREHAALAPQELGIRAVFARSFARIHRNNLINCGIVPILCDTDLVEQDNHVEVDFSEVSQGAINVFNTTTNRTIPARVDLSKRERAIIQAGGILGWTRQQRSKRNQ